MILDNEVYNVLPPLVSECWEINNIRDLPTNNDAVMINNNK